MVDNCAVWAKPKLCGSIRCRRYTFSWLEKRARPTQWSKTLPVVVGELRGFQQACGRLHSSCETHFGSTRGDGNGSDVGVTHLTSKNSGSELVTRLIIWSTHGELFLGPCDARSRSATPARQKHDMISMLNSVDLGSYARACASYAVHNGVPQEVLDT